MFRAGLGFPVEVKLPGKKPILQNQSTSQMYIGYSNYHKQKTQPNEKKQIIPTSWLDKLLGNLDFQGLQLCHRQYVGLVLLAFQAPDFVTGDDVPNFTAWLWLPRSLLLHWGAQEP